MGSREGRSVIHMLLLLLLAQQSFMTRLMDDKNSEMFFKVFYDYVKNAQAEIKASVVVNTADTLGIATPASKDAAAADCKKKQCTSPCRLRVVCAGGRVVKNV